MFAQWIEQPYETLSWLKQRRTVFLQKTENLRNKKTHCAITWLNNGYKKFTGLVCNYMIDNARSDNIMDKSQVGTCSGIWETLEQLTMDNSIVDNSIVRNKKRSILWQSKSIWHGKPRLYNKGVQMDGSTSKSSKFYHKTNGRMED